MALSAQIGYIMPCLPRKLTLLQHTLTHSRQMAKPGFTPGPSAIQASTVTIGLWRWTYHGKCGHSHSWLLFQLPNFQ